MSDLVTGKDIHSLTLLEKELVRRLELAGYLEPSKGTIGKRTTPNTMGDINCQENKNAKV